jgi:hypothetical protein
MIDSPSGMLQPAILFPGKSICIRIRMLNFPSFISVLPWTVHRSVEYTTRHGAPGPVSVESFVLRTTKVKSQGAYSAGPWMALLMGPAGIMGVCPVHGDFNFCD